jgi:hypothetical protein
MVAIPEGNINPEGIAPKDPGRRKEVPTVRGIRNSAAEGMLGTEHRKDNRAEATRAS